MVAAASGNVDALTVLLNGNAHCKFPMKYSGLAESDEVVEVVTSEEDHQETPEEKNEDDFMAERGFKLPIPKIEGRTPLHEAALARNQECLALLLKHKAEVNSQDSEENTALHCAVCDNDEESEILCFPNDTKDQCVQLLLDYGADLSTQNKEKESPLDSLLHHDKASKGVEVGDVEKFIRPPNHFRHSGIHSASQNI
ncbi:ankyrin repeat and SOCS box protein 2-like [Hetaerina americana]|uniref:ankyrin repeat and SOCS box protein 2-like n=1 Tax=Hetaerina americana TaxID=62018 RepID=UPI003A7F2B6E